MGAFSGPYAYLLGDTAETLFADFGRQLTGPKSGPDDLLFVLQDMWIDDRAENGKICGFYLRAQLFMGHDNQYRLDRSIDTIFELEQKLLTSFLPSEFAANSIRDVMLSAGRQPATGPVFSAADAGNYEQHLKAGYAVYNAPTLKTGIYATVTDFLNLTPTDTAIIYKHVAQAEGPGMEFFYHPKENGRAGEQIGTDAAAFICIDGKAFVRRGKSFAKMKLINGEFYASFAAQGAVNTNLGLSYGFGLIGVLGDMAAEKASPDKRKLEYRYYSSRLSPERLHFVPVRRIRNLN